MGHTQSEMEVQPTLREIKAGWLAMGEGWAAYGRSEQEALAAFAEATRRHAEIDSRPLPGKDEAESRAES